MREDGFYWVKCTESEGYCIAEFTRGEFWYLCGTNSWCEDEHLYEIDERRIVREVE